MNDKGSKHRGFNPGFRDSSTGVPQGRIHSTTQVFRTILDATTEAYGRWNLVAGGLSFDGYWQPARGTPPSELPEMRGFLEDCVHPDDRATFGSRLEAHLAGKTPRLDCQLRLRTQSGQYKWFEVRGKIAHTDHDGTPAAMAGTLSNGKVKERHRRGQSASHEQLSAIFQAAEDCISVVDPVRFRLIAYNKAYENLIFKARGIHVQRGMRPADINPSQAERWIEFYRQVLEQGEASRDYELHSLDLRLHIFAKCLVRDEKTYGICVFGHDVTDRRRAEQALRKSEEKFAKAFREGPMALALTRTRDHRYIEVNEAFLEATGYRRDEVIGKSPFDLGIWVNPEQRSDLVHKILAAGEVRNFEFPFRAKTGEIRLAMGSAVQIEIDGEPCMLGVSQDITERKHTLEALRESEERLTLAIESGRMYAFAWDPATDLVQRSKQAEALLNPAGDAFQNTKSELIGMIHAEDREAYVNTLSSLSPDNASYRIVFRLPRRDRNMLWLEESGRALFDASGKINKVVGMTIDVTEFREAERTLRELSGRLISSQEEERRRIARELHDQIGQQLALACVQAQRLASGGSDVDCAARNHALELYKRIQEIALDVSKLSHRLHSSELDFLGLAAAAERLCRDFEDQYGVIAEFLTRNLPPKLDKDKSRCFYRVLQEALQNVAKHSRANRVTVELEAQDSQLTLRIIDNGAGFETTKRRSGAGLGLISIRERLNLVGGTFTLSSKAGSGTTLAATVPL